MKYGNVWRFTAVITVVGLLIFIIGLQADSLFGTGIAVLGLVLMVGAVITTVGEAKLGMGVSPVAGGVAGYLIVMNYVGGIIGGSVGLAVGVPLGLLYGRWVGRKKVQADKNLHSAMSRVDSHKGNVFEKFNDLNNLMTRAGHQMRVSGSYKKEMKYIKDRMKSIRYNSNSHKSIENAASTYIEIGSDIDRLRTDVGELNGYHPGDSGNERQNKQDGPYTPGSIRLLDADKYSQTFGGKDNKDTVKKTIKKSSKYSHSLKSPTGRPVEKHKKKAIPNYSISLHINSNEFADVFFGTSDDGEEIVIKLPRISKHKRKDLSTLASFMTSIELWEKLDHDNIVKVRDLNIKPSPHIAMERMSGGDLSGLMKSHRLTVGEAVNIMLQLLKGVSHAHKKATVHRSLKPTNILFTKDGVPKISDWGWDKFLENSIPMKFSDKRCRLAYCAPEQIDKRSFGSVDAATDIFQLGIIFYEMLTGENPFHDVDSRSVRKRITENEPEPPSHHNPEVIPELDAIVMKALSKSKAGRWKNVKTMNAALERLVEGTKEGTG